MGVHKTPLKCAACYLDDTPASDKPATQTCNGCKHAVPMVGPPHGFSPILIRESLDDPGKIWQSRWKCFECQHPQCITCHKRPEFAGPASSFYTDEGKYMCGKCRRPPCVACGVAERPNASNYSVKHMPEWVCACVPLAPMVVGCVGSLFARSVGPRRPLGRRHCAWSARHME